MRTLLLAVISCLLFDQGHSQEKPTIRYEGSSTIGHFIEDAQSVYGSAQFEIKTEMESAGGEHAIIKGTADIGGVARIPSPQVLGKGVVSTLIGWDAIAIVVNKDNPVVNLTKDQLRGIFSNRISNWSELGGPDLKIIPYIVGTSSATRKVFRSAVLGQEYYAGCETVEPDIDILSRVAADAGAIGQISFSFLNNGNEQLKTIIVDGQEASVTNQSYPITRPLYILWWPGRKATADFAKWTQTKEAQELIIKRFIGKTQETVGKTGKLIVYTHTYAVEEGGAYFYPHEAYEIYSADGMLIQRVTNHLDPNDENPTPVDLQPGQYLIWTESAKKIGGEKLLVNIEAGQTTRIIIDDDQLFEEVSSTGEQPLVSGLKFYGDFRFRVEQDWDSRRTDGTYRDDRGRLRYRFRFGFNYKWNDNITFGGRLRSGDPTNPQGPHITLGDNAQDKGISIDRAYVKATHKRMWTWLGKNNNPFWKQNEMWWDDDVTPEGIALGGSLPINASSKVNATGSYFVLNSTGQAFTTDAAMLAGQFVYTSETSSTALTLASGYYSLSDLPDRSDTSGMHVIDYPLLISGVELRLKTKTPIRIGMDHMYNLSDYSDDEVISMNGLQNEKEGFVGSIRIGSLSDKGKFLFAYYYSHIEKYAVVPYIAQDDWVRWDNSPLPGSRSSNFDGHEIRLGYAFGKGFNLISRLYLVEAIKKDAPTDSNLETGNRFRLDLNLNF